MSKEKVTLCDGEWCTKYTRKLATRVCVGCNRDLCGENHCSAAGYFDEYLPYELKSDLDFCSYCARKISLLKKEDISQHMPFDKSYVSTSSFSAALKEHIQTEFDESKLALTSKLQNMFTNMLDTADKRYGKEQQANQRKQEIQEEIEKLEKKKKELQTSIK